MQERNNMNKEQEREYSERGIITIPLDQIDDFPDHPFQVRMDQDMEKLILSIRMNGLFNPIAVRQKPDGRYETISGHRRRKACTELNMKEIQAVVMDMDDNEAAIAMVDSNLHREHILVSEKAFAYRKKLFALKKQGLRTDLTSCPLDKKLRERRTAGKLGKLMGYSSEQVYRYVRITYLKEDLLGFVDNRSISFRAAVELSYLKPAEQEILCEEMEYMGIFPTLKSACLLRNLSKKNEYDSETVRDALMQGRSESEKWLRIPFDTVRLLIPNEVGNDEMEDFILELLRSKRKKWGKEDGIPEKPE